MQARDAMTTTFMVIPPDTTLKAAAQLMRDGGYGYLPVGEGDDIRGTLTDRDLVVRGLAEGLDMQTPVSRIIDREVIYCFDDSDLAEAADVMAENRVRRLVILDRHKHMLGVLSVGDIARAGGDQRLVGHIENGVARAA